MTQEQIQNFINQDDKVLKKADCSKFLKRMIKELNEHEAKENSILERGCAESFPYAGTLENICQYVSQYIRSNNPVNNQWKVVIPKKLTKAIDFLKELDLIIIVDIIEEDYTEFLKSCSAFEKDLQVRASSNEKLQSKDFIVHAYVDNERTLFKQTLYNTLAYELSCKLAELKNTPNDLYDGENKSRLKLNKQLFSKNEEIDELIQYCVCCLFISSRFIAFNINRTYENLREGFYSRRKTFLDSRKHLQPYYIYHPISSKLPLLNEVSDEEWMNIKNFLEEKENTTESDNKLQLFKNRFYYLITDCLKKLYDGIIQVANIYYTAIEEYDRIQEFKNAPEYILHIDEKMYINPDEIIRLEEKNKIIHDI